MESLAVEGIIVPRSGRTKHDDDDDDTPRIIIVGAGLAGLRCAKDLVTKHGFDEAQIVVLEASERIGGRIKTDRTFVEGFPVSALRYNNTVQKRAICRRGVVDVVLLSSYCASRAVLMRKVSIGNDGRTCSLDGVVFRQHRVLIIENIEVSKCPSPGNALPPYHLRCLPKIEGTLVDCSVVAWAKTCHEYLSILPFYGFTGIFVVR